MVVIKDLLHLPHEISTKVLSHPVITTFIEKRWLQTRWSFLISFTLYLVFVLLFSSFLWLMYERYEENDMVRIPVKLPQRCDKLEPTGVNFNGRDTDLKSRISSFDLEPIDVTSTGLTARRVKFED